MPKFFFPLLNMVAISFGGGLMVGCQSLGKSSQTLTLAEAKLNQPVDLLWVGTPGRTEKSRYYSHSSTRSYDGLAIRHQREEIVEFVVQSKVTKVDAQTQQSTYEIMTLEKDGPVNLKDMAFPELGETLELVLTKKAKIVSAGTYPKTSIFFVPPVSLPNSPVEVGSTWTLTHEWMSLNNGMRLQLNLVTILKGVYECGQNDRCFEMEVSGDVELPDMKNVPASSSAHLESKVNGRILYSQKTSSIIWSDVRNKESFLADGMRVEVLSCIQSKVEEPTDSALPAAATPVCNPNEPMPEVVPGAQSAGSASSAMVWPSFTPVLAS